jgi:hypothetical protein
MEPLPDPYTHPLMSVPEVAACLGIHRTTVWRWRWERRIAEPDNAAWDMPGSQTPTTAIYAYLGRPLPAPPIPLPPPVKPRVVTLTPPE